MNIEFLYNINILLIARLILTFNDQGIKLKQFIFITAFQITALILFTNIWTLVLLGFLILFLNLIFFLWEQQITTYIYEIRILSFLIQLILFSIFCAPGIGLHFNATLLSDLIHLNRYSVLLAFVNNMNWINAHIILMGFLLVLNESNLVIRSIFHLFRIFPGTTNEALLPKIDHREYNAGRIIGILERILIYFAVLFGQFAAIGFLMAAKGFTRFKELDERNFAEYILIGTLLSALMAIFIGLFVNYLMP